jgi:hypothetical protein
MPIGGAQRPRGGQQEDDMKIATITAAIAFAACSVASAAEDSTSPAATKQVCIQAPFVDHTTVLSDTEILFYMKDRKIWKNTLPRACQGLKFEKGFSQVLHGDTICSNMHTIRVLNTGTPCNLGEFTPYTPPPKP